MDLIQYFQSKIYKNNTLDRDQKHHQTLHVGLQKKLSHLAVFNPLTLRFETSLN